MAESLGRSILGALGKALRDTVKYQVDKYTKPKRRSSTRRRSTAKRSTSRTTSSRARRTTTSRSTKSSAPRRASSTGARLADVTAFAGGYPGDYTGALQVSYSPQPGDTPDPGEVVWTWVPYEEDHSQGKDRPVLLIGRDDPWLLGVPLTSKDHDRDENQEANAGRFWVDVGSGDWDSKGRASEARVDRIVRVDISDVRREGGVLDRTVFDEVAAAVQQYR